MNPGKYLSLDDFERAARRRLPPPIYAYVSGGVEENLSRDDNRAAFEEWGFVPRVLVGTADRRMETELFGQRYSAPFGIAPMGFSALSAYRGDLVEARAAAAARIPMIMSGTSLIRLEDVCTACPGTWFQAYLPGKPERNKALVDRVEAAGFETLVITVDVSVLSNRENNIRAGFSAPLRPSWRLFWSGVTHPRWTLGTFMRTLLQHGMPHLENNYAERGAPIIARNIERDLASRDNINWGDIDTIRRRWKGKLVLKGIVSAEDTRIARESGVDGVIVSNHGGRQLDGTVSPLRVLPSVVREAGAMTVMMDSGIRRGTDVLKALALGAKFVWVGRPFNYAATMGGEAGVAHAISILKGEVYRNMSLVGVNAIAELNRSFLEALPPRR
ncbi:MAG TPA: alpha-hydroxy acid oxidase [Usitatibacter sp.]|nr:alpha-hydroxy acid oxidase [Usitatibacter sp.]